MKTTTKIDIFVLWLLVLVGALAYNEDSKLIQGIFGLSLALFTSFLCYIVFQMEPADHLDEEDQDEDPKMFI